MLNLTPATQIFIVRGPTDMRKSFNGLMAIVKNDLKADIWDQDEHQHQKQDARGHQYEGPGEVLTYR